MESRNENERQAENVISAHPTVVNLKSTALSLQVLPHTNGTKQVERNFCLHLKAISAYHK